jgi:DNA-binding NarL/FixJ family response regulator
MKKINVIIADGSCVFGEGLKNILMSDKSINVFDVCCNLEKLDDYLINFKKIDLIFLDFSSRFYNENKLVDLRIKFPALKIIAITPELPRTRIINAIKSGINSYLLKDCNKDEIIEAIHETINGKQFFCGNVFSILQETEEEEKANKCEGLSLSKREIEIIQLIAEGLTNKEIAEKLFLSSHTVNTHRKNLMQKLGLKNTAGIVIYALKENLLHAN